MNARKLLCAAILLLAAATARATSNYEYGPDEYVTISEGISPDGRLAITTHGDGELGYDHFHVYLFDAVAGKKIGPLEEIAGTLDTGADAFAARWKADSSEAMILYRTDRRAPLKAMTYRFAKGRAFPLTPRPVEVHDEAVVRFWQEHHSSERAFGMPKTHS